MRITLALFSFISFFAGAQVKNDSLSFAEVKGKKQYYLIKGYGSPTVVFITGLGPTMDDFRGLQNTLAKTTRAFCYDRAGMGMSESYNNERDLENISVELKELLDKVGLDEPVVLAGHSRGGLIARYFANKYPNRVCGLILIDPAIPEHRHKKMELRNEKEKIELDNYYRSFYSDTAKFSTTIKNEFKNTFTKDSAQAALAGFPKKIPITLIASVKLTRDKYSKEDVASKIILLKSYLKQAPQMKLIFTDRSGHYIYDDEPALVIKEIILMLKKLKSAHK